MKIFDLDNEWFDWISTRPPVIQKLAAQFPPNILYRLNDTNVLIYSYNENSTFTVSILDEYNPQGLAFERNVFGVGPNDLTECKSIE